MNQKQLDKLINKFHKEMLKDPTFTKMIEEYTQVQMLTGVSDPIVLGRLYDYMDSRIAENIKLAEEKFNGKNNNRTG